MTKRDYIAMAAVIREEREAFPTDHTVQLLLDRVADHVASVFEKDNPRFSRDTFLAAARIQ